MRMISLTFVEEGRYGTQSTHVTYATQSAHTYQPAAQPQSAAYARDAPASGSSKYGNTASSQSAFSSYPSHYTAHPQKAITEAHYPAGYRVPAPTGQHSKLSISFLIRKTLLDDKPKLPFKHKVKRGVNRCKV